MLSTAKSNRVGGRLIGLAYSTTGATVTAIQGIEDGAGGTYNGVGDVTGTLKEPFRRTGLCIVTTNTDVGAGSYAAAVATASRAEVTTFTNGGVAAEGTVNLFVYGWDNSSTDSCSLQQVLTTGLAPRLLPFRLSAPGTLAEGSTLMTASAVANTTTLSFLTPFNRKPIVIAIPDTTGNSVTFNTQTAANSLKQVSLTQNATGGGAALNGIHGFVLGWDEPNSYGRGRKPLKVAQQKPRILAGKIVVTAGVGSVALYSDLGTLTKNGVGDWTLTFSTAFKRAPVVAAEGAVASSISCTSTSTTACRIVATTPGGVALDTTLDVFILGFDWIDQTY